MNSNIIVTDETLSSHGNDEHLINWVEEAAAIINDVKAHVAEISISSKLPSTESKIYLNLRTFEGDTYCIHVSSVGFRIVSQTYDSIDDDKIVPFADKGDVFETPHALLDKISPGYVNSFGNQLCKQLLHLQQMRTEFKEEDEEDLEKEEEDKAAKECTESVTNQ
uniref:GSKIP domain-containing protein n=1 Tax=Glossina brevipalpis TaxID=37001 RepID=A0A1A9WHB1_9MUSC